MKEQKISCKEYLKWQKLSWKQKMIELEREKQPTDNDIPADNLVEFWI
jgi:hypothetical protein